MLGVPIPAVPSDDPVGGAQRLAASWFPWT